MSVYSPRAKGVISRSIAPLFKVHGVFPASARRWKFSRGIHPKRAMVFARLEIFASDVRFLRFAARIGAEKRREIRERLRDRNSQRRKSKKKRGGEKENEGKNRNSRHRRQRCGTQIGKWLIKLESPVVEEMGDRRQWRPTCWRCIKRSIGAAVPLAIAKRNVTRGGRRVCGSSNTILSREIWPFVESRDHVRSDEKSSVRENAAGWNRLDWVIVDWSVERQCQCDLLKINYAVIKRLPRRLLRLPNSERSIS